MTRLAGYHSLATRWSHDRVREARMSHAGSTQVWDGAAFPTGAHDPRSVTLRLYMTTNQLCLKRNESVDCLCPSDSVQKPEPPRLLVFLRLVPICVSKS